MKLQQFEYVSKLLNEVIAELGSWIKQQETQHKTLQKLRVVLVFRLSYAVRSQHSIHNWKLRYNSKKLANDWLLL